MLESGLSPDDITVMYKLSRKTLSKSEMETLFEWGYIDTKTIREELRHQGYSEDYTDVLGNLIVRKRAQDIKKDIAKSAINLYEQAEIGKNELQQYLSVVGYSTEEITLETARADLEKERKASLTDADIARTVEKEIWPWSKARDMLVRRGYSRETAEIFLKLRVKKERWFK